MAFGIDDLLIGGLGALGSIFGGKSNQSQSGSSSTNTSSTANSNFSGNSATDATQTALPPEFWKALMGNLQGSIGADGMTGNQSVASQYLLRNLTQDPTLSNSALSAQRGAQGASDANNSALSYLMNNQNMGSNTLGKWFGDIAPVTAARSDDPLAVTAARGIDLASPYASGLETSYVNAALSDYDTGIDRGRNSLRARNAANGGFNNKRTGVAEGVFESDAARGRANLGAGLRYNAFNTAAGFGNTDADRFLQASTTNAANKVSNNQFNANLAQNANLFNANLKNNRQQFDIGQADIGDTRRLGIANNIAGLGLNSLNIGSQNLANGVTYNNAGLGNAAALIGAGNTGINQGISLLNAGVPAFGQRTQGNTTTSGSQTGTQAGTSFTNSTGNVSGQANPFGMFGNFLVGAGAAGWNPFGK